MAFTTVNKSSDFFNTVLYTSTGNDNLAISGVGFEADLTWIKKRNVVSGSDTNEAHYWVDQVRGYNKWIASSSNGAEQTYTNDLKSWQSDGFTLGTNNRVNQGSTPHTYAAWNWKASGTNISNSSGSNGATLASAGIKNDTAGMSIVTYTGDGNARTVYHGLSNCAMVIHKCLNSSEDWGVQHKNIGAAYQVQLNTNIAKVDKSGNGSMALPAANVFSVNNSGQWGSNSNNYIAYCFAEKTGYSKFGSYTGNGNADGPFIYTGMRPSFVIFKRTDSTSNWRLFDNKRLGYNSANSQLYPNLENPEDTGTNLDILSNGFKVLTTSGDMNGSGGTYIYMAFGQSIVGSNNIPATAR